MKKIIFDMNPLGSFAMSSETYRRYYMRKYNKKIYFYTRNKGKKYKRVDDSEEAYKLKNRVITFIDLGKEVNEIPYDEDIRVSPIDESYEDDELLVSIVGELGENANWKGSDIRVIEVEDNF